MGLSVQLDRQGDKPLYQQIAQQIKSRINRGLLSPGTRLPTVRQLAAELGVTRLTVHNAYSELQAGGWIEATVGRGTFVSASVRPQELLADIGQQLTADDAVRNMTSISQMTGLHSLAYAFPDAGSYLLVRSGRNLCCYATNCRRLCSMALRQATHCYAANWGLF